MCFFFKKIILSIYTPYKHTNRISSNKVAIKILSTTFLSLMDEQSQNGESFRGIFQAHFNIASWKESIEKDGSVVYSITGETVYGQF